MSFRPVRVAGSEDNEMRLLGYHWRRLGTAALLTAGAVHGGAIAPPAIVKSFGAVQIPVNGTTTLTFTITAPNALPGVYFTDNLPAGMIVATPNGLSTTCPGAPTMVAGGSAISVTGLAFPAAGSCSITVNVTAVSTGLAINSVSIGDVDAGTGNTATATALVVFVNPPELIKEFSPTTFELGAQTSLTFELRNPNFGPVLSNASFTDVLPAGLSVNGAIVKSVSCGGPPSVSFSGTNTITVSGASLGHFPCIVTISNITAAAAGSFVNVTSPITGEVGGVTFTGPPATASVVVRPQPDAFQVRYLTLQYGDGVVNFTNAGSLAGTDPAGTMCVNVYAFDPAEEMVSCCACRVTPNGLASISARSDIMGNTLTAGTPQSITVKLLATAAGAGSCNPGTQPSRDNLARGMRAWATTLHSLAAQGSPAPPALTGLAETPFAVARLSQSELDKLTSYCTFIQINGSGFGQCKSCTSVVGAQGGTPK